MRNLGYALAAAIIVLTPLSTKADQIIETLDVPSINTTLFSTTDFSTQTFNQFDLALGTLDSIRVTLGGAATWSGSALGPLLSAFVETPSSVGNYILTNLQGFGSYGPITLDLSGTTLTSGCVICSFFEGTGTVNLRLTLFADNSDTFTSSGFSGNVIYDYTPATVVPEPSSLALLAGSLGLLGLVSVGTFCRRSPWLDRCD